MARLGGSAAAGCSEAAERKCNVVNDYDDDSIKTTYDDANYWRVTFLPFFCLSSVFLCFFSPRWMLASGFKDWPGQLRPVWNENETTEWLSIDAADATSPDRGLLNVFFFQLLCDINAVIL